MCRSIKTLRSLETPATDEDIEAAALQFVRKISGYRQPELARRWTGRLRAFLGPHLVWGALLVKGPVGAWLLLLEQQEGPEAYGYPAALRLE